MCVEFMMMFILAVQFRVEILDMGRALLGGDIMYIDKDIDLMLEQGLKL